MPPAPPDRHATGDFHFHVHDYQQPAPAPFTLSDPVAEAGHMRFYSLMQDMDALRQFGQPRVPNLSEASIGRTAGGRDIRMLSFGNAANNPAVPAVVITGGIHAREWIGVEFAYLLAEYLIKHYPVVAPGTAYQEAIRDLVDSRRIYIIPMLNPDGNHRSAFLGSRLWRKSNRRLPDANAGWLAELTNGAVPPVLNPPLRNLVIADPNLSYQAPVYNRGPLPPNGIYETFTTHLFRWGVDLNRNYPTAAWGHAVTDIDEEDGSVGYRGGNPGSDVYFGTRGGFERETGSVQQRLLQITQALPAGITAMIDYHSYAQMILYPTESWDSGAVGSDYKALGKSLRQLVRSQAARDYQLGTPRGLLGYDGTGSIIDYAAQRHQVRAFTIELDPAYRQQPGFQLPDNQIETVFEKNIRGALALLSAPRRAAGGQKDLIKLKTRQFLQWPVYGRGDQLPT